MESGTAPPLAAAVEALRLLAALPAAANSRQDLAKQQLLRRIELLLLQRQLQNQQQQQKCQWVGWPQHQKCDEQQYGQRYEKQQKREIHEQQVQQEHKQEWASHWEDDAAAEAEALEELEESLLLLCCQQPPTALQLQLTRLLLLHLQRKNDCEVWHHVAARLLAAAADGLHLPAAVSSALAAAAAAPPTTGRTAAGTAAAAGIRSKVLSPLPPLLICGQLIKACPQVLSPLLPLLVAISSKLLQQPAGAAAATPTATTVSTATAVAKALRTAVAATGACGETLAGKLFALTLTCLRCSSIKGSNNRNKSSSKYISSAAAAEATREALLLLQQVVWAFPRGVAAPVGDSLFAAVLAAAAPEPTTAVSAADVAAEEEEDSLEAAQENVPHAAAALAVLLAAKAVAGVQQQKQQQQQQQQQLSRKTSPSLSEEAADKPAASRNAADFAWLSSGQCLTYAAASGAAGAAAPGAASTKGLFSEVRNVEDALALLRRQWLLLHITAAPGAKKGRGGTTHIPLLLKQQQQQQLQQAQLLQLLSTKARQLGLVRQVVAAAVPCLCRLLLNSFAAASLVSSALQCLFTLLIQLAGADWCCSCTSSGSSKKAGAGKGMQQQCGGPCSCSCSNGRTTPTVCCVSLETLHSQALVSHAAKQLLVLLHPQQQLCLVDCLSRAVAAAAVGAAPKLPHTARTSGLAVSSSSGGTCTGSESSGSSCSSSSSSGSSSTHPLLLRAALDIIEESICAAGGVAISSPLPALREGLVAVLTAAPNLQQQQQEQQQQQPHQLLQVRCSLWHAVQRQAAACIWRFRCTSSSPSAVYPLQRDLMQAAAAAASDAAAAAAVEEHSERRLHSSEFAPLWGSSLGLAACVVARSNIELQQQLQQSARPAAAMSTTAEEDRLHRDMADLCGVLARGGAAERACFFLLSEALLQQPAAATAAAAAAVFPAGEGETMKAPLLSPAVCCFLRACRRTLSLRDTSSSINRLRRIAATAAAAAAAPAGSGPIVIRDTAATAPAASTSTGTLPGPASAAAAAGAATATVATAATARQPPAAAIRDLILELTCAFRALAAFMRQQPATAAAAADEETACGLVTLIVEASLILCCCNCSTSNGNNSRLSLPDTTTPDDGSLEAQQQQQQQLVCCRCFCMGAAPPAVAHAGLEAAALEALSLLPHNKSQCSKQQQQQQLLQLALSAMTIPAATSVLFPTAAVACCISPAAAAAVAALRATSVEQLQQQQELVQQLVQRQQQLGTADPALLIGCPGATNSLQGPTLWEAQWRCASDVAAAPFGALWLPAAALSAAPAAAPADASGEPAGAAAVGMVAPGTQTTPPEKSCSATGVAEVTTETGWRAEYPPQVHRVLQGSQLLRRLLSCCGCCSDAAAVALEQTSWVACCSWGRQLPVSASTAVASASRSQRKNRLEATATAATEGGAGAPSHKTSGSHKTTRSQQLLQRLGIPRLRRRSGTGVTSAAASASAAADAEADEFDPAGSGGGTTLLMSSVGAVLSSVFRAQEQERQPQQQEQRLQQQQQQRIPLHVVDSLWCCCEKAFAAAPALERLLFADVAGALYGLLQLAVHPRQQQQQQGQENADVKGLQTVNKHVKAFLELPVQRTEMECEESSVLLGSSRLCSLSLVAARLLPLLEAPEHDAAAAVGATPRTDAAAADASTKDCEELLQLALTVTSSIEAAEEVASASTAGEAVAAPAVAAGGVSAPCALLCVIRFLGAAFPVVAAAGRVTNGAATEKGSSAAAGSSSEVVAPAEGLQQQQLSVLQQQLFRALQFALLLRTSQPYISRAAVLTADAARHLVACLLQQAAAAAAAGPAALVAAIKGPISHAAAEAAYLISVSTQSAAERGSSSSEIVLQLVSAVPAIRCLTALLRIQALSGAAATRPAEEAAPADVGDSQLAAAALSLQALLPAIVATAEFAAAAPSLVVRREAAQALLSLSLPLEETPWAPTAAAVAAAAAAAPESVAAAAAPVAVDPHLALFLFEALNSEQDSLQQKLLLQLLLQQVRLWGPTNLLQWVSLLTYLCCSGTAASPSLNCHVSSLTPCGSINSNSRNSPTDLLLLAQQLLPQTPRMLLSPLAAARALPPLTGLVWRPLPGISAPSAAAGEPTADSGLCDDLSDSSSAEVQPVVCAAAAECLLLLLNLPELQQQQHHWTVSAAKQYKVKRVRAATTAGASAGANAAEYCLIDSLAALVRAACELLLRGVRDQPQQQTGTSRDEGLTLAGWGLQLLLLLLQRFIKSATGTELGLPEPLLRQQEVAVSAAVTALLRHIAPPTPPDPPSTPDVHAIAAAAAAAEDEATAARRRAALLRLRAAVTCGLTTENVYAQQQEQQQEQQQHQQLTAMSLEVLFKFAEAGCCLSPWRLVGQLLLPLGDVAQSSATVLAAAAKRAGRIEAAQVPAEWLLRRRLLLACQLLGYVTCPPAASSVSTAGRAAAAFSEQREQWVAAMEPCAISLSLHIMAAFLQDTKQVQEQEKQQLLRGLLMLCRPLPTADGSPTFVPAEVAFAALAAVTRSRTGPAAANVAETPRDDVSLTEASCLALGRLADALLQPIEAVAAKAREAAAEAKVRAAAATWLETGHDELCWRLEITTSLLLCVSFSESPEQRQQRQQQHSGGDTDWADDWLAADNAADFVGAPDAAVAPAAIAAHGAAASERVASQGSAAAASFHLHTWQRACDAVAALAKAAAATVMLATDQVNAQENSSTPAGAAGFLKQEENELRAAELSKEPPAFSAIAPRGTAAAAAGRVIYCCISHVWRLAAALQRQAASLKEATASVSFFTAVRDVSTAALSLPADTAAPAAATAAASKGVDLPPGELSKAALCLLQRCFCVVGTAAALVGGTAADAAFLELLTPLECPCFLVRLCEQATLESPVETVQLLRSLYEAAARASNSAAAAAAAELAVTAASEAEGAKGQASTRLLMHCSRLIESAVSSLTAAAAGGQSLTPPATRTPAANTPQATPVSRDTEGVLTLAAALVAVEALALASGPWNSMPPQQRKQQGDQQQQEQPEWCVRIGAALQRLSGFAYTVEQACATTAIGISAETAAATAQKGDSEQPALTPDTIATAEEAEAAAAASKPASAGKAKLDKRKVTAAGSALSPESAGATAATSAAEGGTEAARAVADLVPKWPASRQHAAAQFRGLLLRLGRLCSQHAAAASGSLYHPFPYRLAAAAVSCLTPALSLQLTVSPLISSSSNNDGTSSSDNNMSELSALVARQKHPLQTLEAFLQQLTPISENAVSSSCLFPLTEALVDALSCVVVTVLTSQAETAAAATSPRKAAQAAVAQETSVAEEAVAAPDQEAVACDSAAKTSESTAEIGASDRTIPASEAPAAGKPAAATVGTAHFAELAAAELAATAPKAPSATSAADTSAALATEPVVGATEPSAAATEAPAAAPAAATPEAEPSAAVSGTEREEAAVVPVDTEIYEAQREAYRSAAARLLYLAVAGLPAVASQAISAAAAAVSKQEAAKVTETTTSAAEDVTAASAGCMQQVKAAVAQLLQQEVVRRKQEGA